ncbi:hypothetical protein ANN_24860 [Periplaneta americana]|uniref:Uncharacterized protein n=1 Tax=Periplaneta americana TaxID=6978 RepID=A0ABQ8RZS8_PERAM|nr:hypothetical protein ANN_24860 [Periplaneta americana]
MEPSRCVNQWRTNGSVVNTKHEKPQKTVGTPENIRYLIKLQACQELRPEDRQNRPRLQFYITFLERVQQDEPILSALAMSDEAKFHLSGFVNKQNLRYYADKNPQLLHDKSLHSQTRYWSFHWHCSYDFHVTVLGIGNRYYVTLSKRLDFLGHCYCDTPCTVTMISLTTGLSPLAAIQLRSQAKPSTRSSYLLAWPPNSPDLTSPDFFVWGFVEDIVYSQKSRNIDDLRIFPDHLYSPAAPTDRPLTNAVPTDGPKGATQKSSSTTRNAKEHMIEPSPTTAPAAETSQTRPSPHVTQQEISPIPSGTRSVARRKRTHEGSQIVHLFY